MVPKVYFSGNFTKGRTLGCKQTFHPANSSEFQGWVSYLFTSKVSPYWKLTADFCCFAEWVCVYECVAFYLFWGAKILHKIYIYCCFVVCRCLLAQNFDFYRYQNRLSDSAVVGTVLRCSIFILFSGTYFFLLCFWVINSVQNSVFTQPRR